MTDQEPVITYADVPAQTYGEAQKLLQVLTEPRTREQVLADLTEWWDADYSLRGDPMDELATLVWEWIEHERRGLATTEAQNDVLSSQVLDLQHRLEEYRQEAQKYITELEQEKAALETQVADHEAGRVGP